MRMFPEARLTAVDLSKVFLETAKRNLEGYDAEFHLGELSDLNLRSRATIESSARRFWSTPGILGRCSAKFADY